MSGTKVDALKKLCENMGGVPSINNNATTIVEAIQKIAEAADMGNGGSGSSGIRYAYPEVTIDSNGDSGFIIPDDVPDRFLLRFRIKGEVDVDDMQLIDVSNTDTPRNHYLERWFSSDIRIHRLYWKIDRASRNMRLCSNAFKAFKIEAGALVVDDSVQSTTPGISNVVIIY